MRERYYLLKRQNKIKTTMRLSAAMVFLSMLLCACTEASQNQEMPAATYMGGKDTIAGICEELESAGASHVDTFREWTTDFADTAGKMPDWRIAGQIPENESRYRKMYGWLGTES